MRALSRSLLSAGLFAMVLLFFSSSAFAIDGYKDRHGLFVGIGLGGGPGSVHLSDDRFTSGLDNGGELGLHLLAAVGGGVTDSIVFSAELNTWIRTVSVHNTSLNHQHWSLIASGDFFLFEGFYLGAGTGLAYAFSDITREGIENSRYQEMGLAAKGSAGYEFFLNGTVAAGFRLSYTRHFYSGADFDTFHGGVTLRWY